MNETHDIFQPIADKVPDENGCIDGFCPLPTKSMPVNIDYVNHPPHYCQGGLESIEVMKAFASKEEFIGHLRLTAIKYLLRLNNKDSAKENAEKSQWYISKLVEELSA